MGMHTMFVYGTLKRGYGNNERCLIGAGFLSKAISVESNYIMQEIGFPIIWQEFGPRSEKAPTGQVTGELFTVTDKQLAACDRLEGHPRMYKREQREFLCTDRPGGTVTAWVYLWQGPTDRGSEVSYGDEVPLIDGVYTWDLAHRKAG